MVKFDTTILQFEEKGEKSGWFYIEIPVDVAETLQPGNKKSFKVKGLLDKYRFTGKSLLPMGGGIFIMPLDATTRKNIHKGKGSMIHVQLDPDSTPFQVPGWIVDCLEDEPRARERFMSIPKSHQNYYIKWIESAKTEETKARRLAQMITACVRGLTYGEMMRMNREDKLL
jgi:hypothetical protein